MNWIDDLIKDGDAELSVLYQQQIENNHERQFLAVNAVAVWDELKRIVTANVKEITTKSKRTALLLVEVHVNSVQLCGPDRSLLLDVRFSPEAFQLVVWLPKIARLTHWKQPARPVSDGGSKERVTMPHLP